MRRSASEPSCVCGARSTGPASRGLKSGRVFIKASLGSTKTLAVQLVATARELEINIVQDWGDFSLCSLQYHTLAAGWFWNDPTLFVLAVAHRGRLHHDIYCYPTDATRTSWLRVFEALGVTLTPVYYSQGRIMPQVPEISVIPEIISESSDSVCGAT